MATPLQLSLGKITLPATTSPGAKTLIEYQRAVDVWTRQCEQTFRQVERSMANLTTAEVPQGGTTNIYWSQALFDAAFADKTTDDLAEGVTNLYFTPARARAAISATAPIAYDSGTGIISLTTPLAVQYGGTGAASYTAGRILFGNGTSPILSSANFTWSEGDLTLTVTETIVTNNLTVDNITSSNFTANRLLYANAFKLIQSAAVTTPLDFTGGVLSIPNASIVYAKIQNVTSDKLLGRASASTGVVQEVGVVGPLVFQHLGGNLAITQSDATHDGYISSTDWSSFDSRVLRSGDTMTGTLLIGSKISLAATTGICIFGGDGITVGRMSIDGVGGWDINGGVIALDAAVGAESLTVGTIQLDAVTNIITTPGGISVHSGGNIAVSLGSKFSGDGSLLTNLPATSLTGTVAVANGGTGLTSYVVGDIIYASGATTLSKLADIATGNALISGGVTTAPAWGKIGLTTHVSGTLAVGNGGTDITSYAVGDILYASGATTLSKLADVATGNVLISGGVTTAPAWGKVGLTTHVTGTLPVGNGGTGLTTFGGTNRLLYTTATDTISSITTANTSALITDSSGVPAWTSGGTANRLLRTNGTTITFGQAVLTTDVTGTLPVTNGGTGLASLAQGDILYASASNTISALAKNTTATRYLANTGTSNNPAWAQITLTNGVTGTLPVGNGGTGTALGVAAGRVVLGNGTTNFQSNSAFAWDLTNLALNLGGGTYAGRLTVVGIAGSGGVGQNGCSIIGGAGDDTTGTVGGNCILTGGKGGDQLNANGGVGGALTLTGGAGGVSNDLGVSGAGGALTFTGGAGGVNTLGGGGGAGGAFTLVGGAGGTDSGGGTSGVGGNVLIDSGVGGTGAAAGVIKLGATRGRVAVGSVTPTALLHIAAGTATASTAPLKFTSGTNLTTAETGAVEYNGTNLFFTRTGTTRESVFVGVSGATAPATSTIGVVVDYYGTSATRVLTTPNSWASVVIGGTTYKIPLYT